MLAGPQGCVVESLFYRSPNNRPYGWGWALNTEQKQGANSHPLKVHPDLPLPLDPTLHIDLLQYTLPSRPIPGSTTNI